jgi:predicted transcriptional regulator
MMVTPAGNSTNFTIPQYPQYNSSIVSANNGIGYSIYTNNLADSNGNYRGPTRLSDLVSWNIMASDFRSGKNLWNFTTPTGDQNVITLSPSNVKYLDEMRSLNSWYGGFFYSTANDTIEFNKDHQQLQNLSKGQIGTWAVTGSGTISLMPEDNILYVSYYMSNYEYPNMLSSEAANGESDRIGHSEPVFNRSRLAYMSGVLAIDNEGHLLWNKPTDSLVTTMAVNNSTVYYSTKDGKLFATQANTVLGFALIAVAYLFIRFICVGAVARARSRIDKNVNRNSVMQYVVANPGSTLRDISRGMRMNLGTVRYHIFILSLNHRIVTYQADGKHVRYFINSGTYSKEEQMIMSVMRRDGMRKILAVLLTNPGLSNVQLSGELGIQESAVSRYMKELAEKGLVVKELAPMGTSAYFLSNDRRVHVAKAMEIMKGA